MAKKKLTGAALAESRVRSQGADAANVYSLPVNPGFDEPNSVDKTRGVEYPGAPENVQAEQGITRRVIKSLQPSNLEGWIKGQIARYDHLPEKQRAPAVARALLAMTTPNATQKQYDAQLRKVEEWRQGKYKTATRGNDLRVGLLRLKEAKHLVIGVRGNWQIEDEEKYRVFNSDPRETHHVQAALDALRLDGAGFISTVIDIAAEYVQPYAPQLLQTHELRVEVNV